MYIEFDPNEKYSNKLTDLSDSCDYFKDAGYVLENNDYVVDIDTIPKEMIHALIDKFNIKTQTVWTDRGVHFYFKKPENFKKGANRISPLGFKYEIKHQGNTKAVTIKRNGQLRKIENEGIREEAPFIFNSAKKYEVLLGKDEGEGRNNSLFVLRSQLAGVKGWRKILTFVNENVFATPLLEDEFLQIVREMHVKAEKDNEYNVASWIMTDLNFVQYGQRYYFKCGSDYVYEDSLLKKIVYGKVGNQKTRYVDEVIKQMQYRCEKINQDVMFDIKLKNGYLRDGKFYELITEDFTPYVIDIEYDEDLKPVKEVEDYIDHLTNCNKSYRDLLIEILGHTLIVNPELKRMLAKFFIFVGGGGNGKGTLLQIIKTILGDKNVTGMGIKELSDEKYMPSFKGKLANLGDDIQDQSINDRDMKILKNISTCDYISTRELYKGAEDLFFTGTLIFTSNHILKSWEKGKSYKRRVMWLPMYTEVTKKDPLFITKLTNNNALKYWLKLIIEGYKRLYERGEFTSSDIVEAFNERYHRQNNPALDFIDGMTKDDFIDKPIKDIYDRYEEWCEDNAVKFNKNMISDVIISEFKLDKGLKKMNGKPCRCFTEKMH